MKKKILISESQLKMIVKTNNKNTQVESSQEKVEVINENKKEVSDTVKKIQSEFRRYL